MADAKIVQLTFPEPDIALVTLNDAEKGANILSTGVLAEFAACLDAAEARPGLAGLIIASGKPGIFIAGADLREFVAGLDLPASATIELATRGRELFRRLARASFVTVAAIDGVCLGGGGELAVWCDRRIVSTNPKTQIGFPEVKLGLFPGWGGTARLPRLIGLSNAVELITGGESVDAAAAYKLGLADDLTPSDQLLAAATRCIRLEQQSGAYRNDRARWTQPIAMSETELTFLGATASALIQGQTKGHYPAPVAALELLLESSQLDEAAAGQREAELFATLFGSPVNRALLNVFFIGDRNKKDAGVADRSIKPRAVQRVGVVGAGIMGAGIAGAVVKRELFTTLGDANNAALARGLRSALSDAAFNKALKGADPEKTLRLAPLLNAATRDEEYAACDLVIEAVIENEPAKRELFARLEPLLAPEAILASNTSAISIERLAEGLKHPERFCGIHFFNPVRRMQLVEVIRGPRSSDATIATAVAFAKSLGKLPIVVRDGPGFLVNRLLLPYMNEALELLLEGVEIKHVERAAKNFGLPMGPITLYDVVGLDTALYAGEVMAQAFPDRVLRSELLAALVKAGRMGQKSGSGFFAYTPKKPDRGTPDPKLADFIGPLRRAGSQKLSEQQVSDRLFLPMVVEATRILEEGKVRDPRDVDLGLIYGIGFPPFRGGLLFWADTLGAAEIVRRLEPLAACGARYAPTPLLLEMARGGKKFYAE